MLNLGEIPPSSIALLQRVLLATDGTLTDVLEAAHLEPVGIRKLSSSIERVATPPAVLEVEPGDRLMHRRVLLVGEQSGRVYAYAESVLAIDRLPPTFRDALLTTDTPMGRLWLAHRMETLKEMLSATRMPIGPLAAHFPEIADGDLLSRAYRLICGGRPLMVITEYFPAE
jgi:chorismate-pyruvate lyase